MKIIYKVWIKDKDDLEWDYLFDNYDCIEEWLEKKEEWIEEKYGVRDYIKEFKVKEAIKCDSCGVYGTLNCYKLIKQENYDINAYCLSCFPNFEIDLTKYIEKEK